MIDGLTGIGGQGALRDSFAALVKAIPEHALVVACDVPSGVDADTGAVLGVAVKADVTVTFGTHKPGLLIDPGASPRGRRGTRRHRPHPARGRRHRDELGRRAHPPPGSRIRQVPARRLGILAGGADYTGAAVLSVGGALHGGAGMVRFASSEPVVQLIRQRWPEAVTTVLADPPALDFGRVQAWIAGPGLGTDARAQTLVTQALATDLPVLIDADGLTVLAAHRELLRRSAPTVLTPHAGELARLLDADRAEIEAHRLDFARRAAAELGATVLLKGSTTLVATRGEPVYVNPTGTPWLSTAGTGDVLSGLIGALLAAGVDAPEAAASGAYLHGLAARLAAGPDGSTATAPITAVDVLTTIPAAIRRLPAR